MDSGQQWEDARSQFEPTYGGVRSSRKMDRKGRELGRRGDNPAADVENDFVVGRRSGERWVKEDQLTDHERHIWWEMI